MRFLKSYIRIIDGLNYRLGRFIMYGVFVIMGVLLWSSISKTFFRPSLWTLEMAQFFMVGYYMLGGPYSIQLGAHVRMDLIYAELSTRRKAMIDSLTIVFLLGFLGVLLWGGWDSLMYSLAFNERSPTAWRPYLWPVKSVMCLSILLMILQSISELFKDILHLITNEPANVL